MFVPLLVMNAYHAGESGGLEGGKKFILAHALPLQ